MVKKTLMLFGVGILSLVLSVAASAQEVATLVLENGERPSGELVDLGGSGFTLRVNGQNRQFATGNVKAVEFDGSAPSGDAQARINAGQSLVLLRNGQIIEGRLVDIGGTRPLRLTVDTPSGRRDFQSNEVAQVYLGGGSPQARATTGIQAAQPGAREITVQASQPWTDTGIIVARGERVQFQANGDITIGANMSSGVGGSPAATVPTSKYPVPTAPVGALIAKIGNGTPFLIGGNNQPITMPANGRLSLGVNDDHLADNSGAYPVSISRLGR
jgi:hypothetical protein